MYFDYTIVLSFALAGGLLALVACRRARVARAVTAAVPGAMSGRSEFRPLLLANLCTAALVMLFPCALVVRDCLRDSGVAQSRGVVGLAVLEVALFLGGLSIALAYGWKCCGSGPNAGARPAESAAHERP